MSFLFGAILLAVAILGGGFEIKEIKVSNVTTSVRIIAGIVGAVFIALGFLEPTIPKSIPWGISAGARMSAREHDKDRFGGDYSCFNMRPDHIEDCEGACKDDAKCAAWTYIKPGLQRPQARCCLKNVVPAVSDNVCCVSGTKIR
jgi:hypothetical protein